MLGQRLDEHLRSIEAALQEVARLGGTRQQALFGVRLHSPEFIAERGEIYRDAAGAAFWQDLYASTQRELLQGTTQSPSRRQGGIKPMRLTRLCLAP